jgi:hypothetical protein
MAAPAIQATSSEIHEIPTSEVTTHLIPSFIANMKEAFLSLFPIGLQNLFYYNIGTMQHVCCTKFVGSNNGNPGTVHFTTSR